MTKTREAIRRLERLELIDVKWHASGEIKSVRRLANKLRTSDNIASLALQQAHAHTLDKAKESIFQIPIHQRDLSAMTMAIDPENLPAAREFTRQYLLNLAELLEQGSRTEVYKVSVQLFPLTELKRNPAQGKLK